ncbi:hypothetical protein CCACVL1_28189, partial [Corchorus capsularis]
MAPAQTMANQLRQRLLPVLHSALSQDQAVKSK